MSVDVMASKALRVSSFTTVGHLLHVNLKEHLLPNKYEIGRALLDKNKRAIVVVNKVNNIENTFRNFEIEIIARREGCDKSDSELMIVEVNENKCRFQMDFSKVYWNSRLSTEHERIISKLNRNHDIVFDLFSGIGPFSVPAAKAKCKTYANDLNPESFRWLSTNFKRNKVNPDYYEITNMDAKEYMTKVLTSRLMNEYSMIQKEQPATKPRIHILMNLPSLAPTFLPIFLGLFRNQSAVPYKINHKDLKDVFSELALDHIVYCYCFLKGVYPDAKLEVRKQIEEQIGILDDDQVLDIFRVRNVSAFKDMYRVELKLDERILFADKQIISIMKNQNGRQISNGTPKKVTIQAPSKRARPDEPDTSAETCDGSVDDDDDNSIKRIRTGGCILI